MVSNPLKISSDLTVPSGQDLAGLRAHAMERLQQLAPSTWTDHNRFDPGITLLEVLVYVLSDLSYKLSFPVEDLLSSGVLEAHSPPQFIAPENALFSHCVTADDYRRLLLDIPEIKNVHIQDKSVNEGSASDTFDFMVQLYDNDDALYIEVKEKIHNVFTANRTINHQLGDIGFYGVADILLSLSLDLANLDDVVAVMTDVLARIGDEISPRIPQYSAEHLRQKGHVLEEIYNGPKLKNGFVLDTDLASTTQKRHVYSSNILSVLDGHPQVAKISEFKFITTASQQGYEYWQTDISPDDNGALLLPEMAYQNIAFFDSIAITIEQQSYTLSEDEKSRIRSNLHALNTASHNDETPFITPNSHGVARTLSQYQSLQHELPKVYAVTEHSLDGMIDSAQKAQLLQFKGYLHLFDQLLADQHKQLDVLPHILSLPAHTTYEEIGSLLDDMLASESLSQAQCQQFWCAVNALPHSQLSQAIQGISGLTHLLDVPLDVYGKQGMQNSVEPAFSVSQLVRLNRSAEHLLARFAIYTPDPNSLKYRSVFALYADGIANSAADQSPDDSLITRLVLLRQYIDKCRLLNEIGELGQNRGAGYNYLSRLPHCDHSAGISQYIMRQIGLSHPGHMPLATNNKESFYALEACLLQAHALGFNTPSTQAKAQMHYVLPDWPTRFQDHEFRALLTAKITADTPLHHTAQCVWLDKETMSLFERLYYGWLNFFGEVQRTRFAQSNDAVSAVTSRLSMLLRQFFEQPIEAIGGKPRWLLAWLIIEEVNAGQDYSAIKLTMVDMLKMYSQDSLGEPVLIIGTTLAEIYDAVNGIIARVDTDFPEGFTADTVFYLSAQQCIDEICKPSLLDSANNNRRFTVGYTPLPYLTPIAPVSLSKINPTSPEASRFIVAKSTANRI